MLREIEVRRVQRSEEPRYQALMQEHHYLGALPKIGETLWYVASWAEQSVALLSFSAAALKCAARDRWIGWSYRQQYARLHLLANNTRFCVLPDWHRPNIASRTLALCERRLAGDWLEAFGHPIVLLETFVDPQRHRGTLYLASNWRYVGDTRGYRRRQGGYTDTAASPKKVFLRPLHRHARALLGQAHLEPPYARGVPELMLTATQMQSLPDFFRAIPIRAGGRDGAIRCTWCWRSPPPQPCAGRAATSTWPSGQSTSPRAHAPAFAAGACAVSTWCRASRSSAMCSCASIRNRSIRLCNAGQRSSPRTIPPWPSMARPCATPPIPAALRPI
jgi:hypothetical protein